MTTKIIAIILLLLFILQFIFNVLLKIEETKFKFRSTIKERDARKLLRRLTFIVWITPTKINLQRVNVIYGRILNNDFICLDTQWAIFNAFNRRFIKKLQKPNDLPYNPFSE